MCISFHPRSKEISKHELEAAEEAAVVHDDEIATLDDIATLAAMILNIMTESDAESEDDEEEGYVSDTENMSTSDLDHEDEEQKDDVSDAVFASDNEMKAFRSSWMDGLGDEEMIRAIVRFGENEKNDKEIVRHESSEKIVADQEKELENLRLEENLLCETERLLLMIECDCKSGAW